MKPAIPASELVNYKADIQRQAIEFYDCKDNVCPGLSRRERWKACIRIVADCWMHLGPQAYVSGPTIYLP
jgi:hypothetical protein